MFKDYSQVYPDHAGCALFRLQALRFQFVARESIHFPAGKSSNILRGAFGTIFRRLVCVLECESAKTCLWRTTCPYARLFEPGGLADYPRPFVFRANHLDGRTISAGEKFHFDLNLFDLSASEYLVRAFGELAQEGLGPGRRKVELAAVDASPLTLDLRPNGERVPRMTVRFLTPTELKSGQKIAARPEFGILAARVCERIGKLRELYGSGPLEIDFREFNERANQVRMTRCEIAMVDVRRRSSRTGQVHSIGGFTGEAEYEGELGEFVPYLKAAKWTGVGRQTVWGKGEIALVKPE